MTLDPNTKQETDRLMRVIAALSAAPDALTEKGRRIGAHTESETSFFDALLTELEETVLRRTLEFRSDDGNVLKLDVAERRLLKIVSCSGFETSGVERLIGRILVPEDLEQTTTVLRAFCETTADLTVTSNLPEEDQPVPFDGLSVEDLKRFCQNTGADAIQAPAFDQIITDVKAKSDAIVCIHDNQPVIAIGNPAECASLESIARRLPEATEDASQLWYRGLHKDLAVVTSRRGQTILAVLLPFEAAADLFRDLS